jgi:Dolichyl-phosphate-mannose-protein mannosyltransferase
MEPRHPECGAAALGWPTFSTRPEPTPSRGLARQAAWLLAVWAFICALHRDNDGLWFQGDSPRHALNGVFWKDFLGHPSTDPVGFALDYYARYPAINPTSYPPAFYLLEAAAFAIVGPSAWAAKGLVLLFALMAAAYATLWLRRYIAPEAGDFGAVLLLMPAVAELSHAVMLNVPALALTTAALYHARRWLDEPESRQLYAAAALGVLAILCYVPSAILVFVALAWLPMLGRSSVLAARRTLVVAMLCALGLLPWMMVILRWSAAHVQMTTPSPRSLTASSTWAYYPRSLVPTFGAAEVAVATVGAVVGLAGRRWRRETAVLLAWIAVTGLVLIYLRAKDPRYLLPMAVPMLGLGAILPVSTAGRAGRASRWTVPALAVALITAMGYQAWRSPIPVVHNVTEIVAFLDRVAPGEPLFYDGPHDGVFTFYVRAADADRRRRVVRGDKLLYLEPLNRSMKRREFVVSRAEVIEALRGKSGCRWLAIEEAGGAEQPRVARLLREAVRGHEFRLIRSFPIGGAGGSRVDIYQVLIPVDRDPLMSIPLPMAGEDFRYEVRLGAPSGGASRSRGDRPER